MGRDLIHQHRVGGLGLVAAVAMEARLFTWGCPLPVWRKRTQLLQCYR